MQKNKPFDIVRPHLIAIIIFLGLSLTYMFPVLQGKTLVQHDVIQSTGMAQQNKTYHQEKGKLPLWSNSMFSGMPAYMVYMKYPNSLPSYVAAFICYNLLPSEANMLFISLLGFYFLLLVVGIDYRLGILGAIGFAFASYNIISIEAGHISKVYALALAAPFLGAVILVFKGKYWIGGALTALLGAIHNYANHIQITYYVLIAIFIYAIFAFVDAFKQATLKKYFTALGVLAVAGLLSVGVHTSRYWTNYEYSKETIRGKSELTTNKNSSGGLDRDYAFSWSYGKAESFTFLIPNFYGGGSQGALSTSSHTYKTLVDKGVPEQSAESFIEGLPLYWGQQPFTSGPAYLGVIICFLFILSLWIVKDKIKWWLLSVVILFLFISWGKNFAFFNNFLFDYIPLYNKFRAVTMVLLVLQIFVVWLALLAIKEILLLKDKTPEKAEILKKLKYTLIGVSGFLLVIGILAPAFLSFEGEGDKMFLTRLASMVGDEGFAKDILNAIRDDRTSMLRMDVFRSIAFVLVAGGVMWAFIAQKIKIQAFYIVLAGLILIDNWGVDKRYLNDQDFKDKDEKENAFALTKADEEILKDKSYYRVLNFTVSPFNDATTSYYHNSIGGYHGAKLRRYQELVDVHIQDSMNMEVLNMLNTKYFITPTPDGRDVVAQKNPNSLGNVWFVKNYKIVPNADAELAGLKVFNPREIAIIQQQYEKELNLNELKNSNWDSTNTIQLTTHTPDELVYTYEAKTPQLAIFSEIYYNNKLGWQAYIDEKPVVHIKANYVLRALAVPAGKHQVKFVFAPKSYYLGEKISLISSLLLIGFVGMAIFISIKKNKKQG